MAQLYFSNPNASIDRLRRRVQAQKNALAAAEQDLRLAESRESAEPRTFDPFAFINSPGAFQADLGEAGPSAYLSGAHEALHAADQRRRAGLGSPGAVEMTAELVAEADRRRREGFGPPPEPTSAFVRQVIAADKKRRAER